MAYLQYIVVGNPDKYIARFFTHMISITIEVFKHYISTFPRPLFDSPSFVIILIGTTPLFWAWGQLSFSPPSFKNIMQ